MFAATAVVSLASPLRLPRLSLRPSAEVGRGVVVRPSRPTLPLPRVVRLVRTFSAAEPPEAGPMSHVVIETMKDKIQKALDAETVEVVDVEGDAQHVTIKVVASAFEGKSSVDRQRMVYKAIWLELQEAVHAVDSMTTATPSEAAS